MCKVLFSKSYSLDKRLAVFEVAEEVYAVISPFGVEDAWKVGMAVVEFITNLKEHSRIDEVSVTITEKSVGEVSVVFSYCAMESGIIENVLSVKAVLPSIESSRGRGIPIIQKMCELSFHDINGMVALEMSPRG